MKEITLKIGMIDDEEDALRYLSFLIAELPGYRVCFSTEDPQNSLALIKEHEPDILLLDVKMPGFNGLALASLIQDLQIPVIFISGQDLSAREAYEVKAVDFLLKPASLSRLFEALKRARTIKSFDLNTQIITKTAPVRPEKQHFLYLAIGNNSFQKVLISGIDYIKGGSDYSEILAEGKKYLDTRSLQDLEKCLLQYDIIRIHKSYMVNMSKAHWISPSKIVLLDGQEFPVGRTYRDYVIQENKKRMGR